MQNETINKIRQSMIVDAKCYNKYISVDYLNKRSNQELLCFVHPIYRADYLRDIEKENENIRRKKAKLMEAKNVN